MRAKRSKQYRKLMQQYGFSFGFREPYQVLLDADIIKDAASHKMRLGSLLEGTLHGSIKPMITQCCIRHLYSAAIDDKDAGARKAKEGWIDVAKGAERRRCGHHELDEPLSAKECLESVVDPKGSGTNKHRYVVASQDQEVRRYMRSVAGVPLIYINRSVMILEPMGAKTGEVREREEKAKVRAGLKSRRPADVPQLKRGHDEMEDGEQDQEEAAAPQAKKQKKAKGPKGPNPLSMKKAKPEKTKKTEETGGDRASKRSKPSGGSTNDDSNTGEGATDGNNEIQTDGPSKRKRKRKPKSDNAPAGESAGGADEGGDDE